MPSEIEDAGHFRVFWDGAHISPSWNVCNGEFWKRIRVCGNAASLSGSGHFPFQGGHWYVLYGDTHYEMFELSDIVALYIENNKVSLVGE